MEWPDWTGQIAAVVASGTSAKSAGVAALEGRARVIAIKRSWELAPFADAVYGCDGPWWKSVGGLPQFKGLKMCYDAMAAGDFGLRKIEIKNNKCDNLLFDQVGSVGAGGNSGFQALNLALQFGSRRIILVGIDATGTYGKEHWYGRNTAWAMNNPDENNYRHWRLAFAVAAKQAAEMGAEIVNASRDSSINCFRKASIQEVLEEWK